ncbi:probable cytochrome P450 303a1 [Neocloeon triangulifer]|uniref:probable cytochrome P450 303a1 n=1 Tax=Neocloeon triangulifer TaxID=2078957 RepID=UPI00286F1060|nr:probable cytochrome P450 303a1 [Neocloeon triangulifer]
MFLALLLFFFVVCLYLYLDAQKPKNFPPGPAWWPVLGSLPEVLRMRRKFGSLSMAATFLAKTHCDGKLVGLRIGNDVQVVLNCAEAMKEMATKPELGGRPEGPFYRYRTWNLRRGIILTDGDFWREQRRFLVHHLKNFGLGKSSQMQSIIMREVHAMTSYFKMAINSKVDGKANLPLHDAFGVPTLNTIWTMLAGSRYEHDDVESRKLQTILADMFASMDMTGCLFNHFPVLRYVMPEASGYNMYMACHKKFWAFLHEEILRHEASYVEGSPRDFMDVYIKEIKSRVDQNSYYSELQLMAICMDLFLAGSDTTSKSLSFAFLHFLRQPHVVKKIQNEIDRVVGKGKSVTLEHKPNMPYTAAAVDEALRVFVGQVIGVPHRAMADSTLLGYFIPKDTILVGNFNGWFMNEEFYEDPWTFNPERFLNEKNEVIVPEHFIPFGVAMEDIAPSIDELLDSGKEETQFCTEANDADIIKDDVDESALLAIPESYRSNSEKEEQVLIDAEKFLSQIESKFPQRKKPAMVVYNECGVKKLLCTFIRRTALAYPELSTWQGIANFVSDHGAFQPMPEPTKQEH